MKILKKGGGGNDIHAPCACVLHQVYISNYMLPIYKKNFTLKYDTRMYECTSFNEYFVNECGSTLFTICL